MGGEIRILCKSVEMFEMERQSVLLLCLLTERGEMVELDEVLKLGFQLI